MKLECFSHFASCFLEADQLGSVVGSTEHATQKADADNVGKKDTQGIPRILAAG